MGIKINLFLFFLVCVIIFPFFFSKIEISFKIEINLPNFVVESGKFSTYEVNITKKGKFSHLDFYNLKNYVAKDVEVEFFDRNSILKSKEIVYNGKYNFLDAKYTTKDYKYLAKSGIYDDKINKLIAYNFRFFNEKVEGRGKRMDYKDKVVKADNIFYVIKGIDD